MRLGEERREVNPTWAPVFPHVPCSSCSPPAAWVKKEQAPGAEGPLVRPLGSWEQEVRPLLMEWSGWVWVDFGGCVHGLRGVIPDMLS